MSGRHALRGLDQLEPAHLGHLEVGHEELDRAPALRSREGLLGVRAARHAVAVPAQRRREDVADLRLVVHHEDVGRGWRPRRRSARRWRSRWERSVARGANLLGEDRVGGGPRAVSPAAGPSARPPRPARRGGRSDRREPERRGPSRTRSGARRGRPRAPRRPPRASARPGRAIRVRSSTSTTASRAASARRAVEVDPAHAERRPRRSGGPSTARRRTDAWRRAGARPAGGGSGRGGRAAADLEGRRGPARDRRRPRGASPATVDRLGRAPPARAGAASASVTSAFEVDAGPARGRSRPP